MTAVNNSLTGTPAKLSKKINFSTDTDLTKELLQIHSEAHNLFDAFGLPAIVRTLNDAMKDVTRTAIENGSRRGMQSAWKEADCITELISFLVAIHEPYREARAAMRRQPE